MEIIEFYKKNLLSPFEMYKNLGDKLGEYKFTKYKFSGKTFEYVFLNEKEYCIKIMKQKLSEKGELYLFRHYLNKKIYTNI